MDEEETDARDHVKVTNTLVRNLKGENPISRVQTKWGGHEKGNTPFFLILLGLILPTREDKSWTKASGEPARLHVCILKRCFAASRCVQGHHGAGCRWYAIRNPQFCTYQIICNCQRPFCFTLITVEQREQIVKSSAVPSIVVAMKNHETDPLVQTFACAALHNLAAERKYK